MLCSDVHAATVLLLVTLQPLPLLVAAEDELLLVPRASSVVVGQSN